MRFSVVIPTYQRRERVTRTVTALARQTHRGFEVIVAVDGSTDETATALRGLDLPFPLVVLEQGNAGRASACNAGARAAGGEVILFLDDDMEAHPALLAEHDRSHREGADVVLGHLPLHPGSPRNLISRGVARWAEDRRARLAAAGGQVPLGDLQTGQMSISRALFERVGGFDTSFTRHGLFGGEDIDFGYRLLKTGARVAFNEAAISYQYYDVDPMDYLLRAGEAGRAAQELMIKHPERAEELGRRLRFASRRSRVVLGGLALAPSRLSWPLRAMAAQVVRSGRQGHRAIRFFFMMRNVEYHRGARRVRRARRTRAAVLAYHAIADLSDDPVLREYGVPPTRFAEQLDELTGRGRRFVGLSAFLNALDAGQPLPSGALLMTFDDGYTDLLTAACPLLAERGIRGVAFAVTGYIGETNEWDRHLGAGQLTLLDADGLRAVAAHGVEIGSHGVSHRPLVRLPPDELADELRDSAARIELLGLPRPAAFSYPHGEWSPESAAAVRDAGYAAAFTTQPGAVRRATDRYALPRIEVFASDTPTMLRLKVATATWPGPPRRALLRLLTAAGV